MWQERGAGGGAQYEPWQSMRKALRPISSLATQGKTVVSNLRGGGGGRVDLRDIVHIGYLHFSSMVAKGQ